MADIIHPARADDDDEDDVVVYIAPEEAAPEVEAVSEEAVVAAVAVVAEAAAVAAVVAVAASDDAVSAEAAKDPPHDAAAPKRRRRRGRGKQSQPADAAGAADAAEPADDAGPADVAGPGTRSKKTTFDVGAWVGTAVSSEGSGRCKERRSLRFMSLSADSPADMDTRHLRNVRVGEAAWYEFESRYTDSVSRMISGIVRHLSPGAQRACRIYLTGNLAARAALKDSVADDETFSRVVGGFPPGIVNVSISLRDPAYFDEISYSVDKGVLGLKRHLDSQAPRVDFLRVNSCLILNSAVREGAVMVDVPYFDREMGVLSPTQHSICKNMSVPSFVMTRLRKAVPLVEGTVQVPLVDVTIHGDRYPPLVKVPLGAGRVFVQRPECLVEHYERLVADEEVAASETRLARCKAALAALHTL